MVIFSPIILLITTNCKHIFNLAYGAYIVYAIDSDIDLHFMDARLPNLEVSVFAVKFSPGERLFFRSRLDFFST